VSPVEIALWVAGTAYMPTASDIRAGLVQPSRRVRIHAIRNGRAVVSEDADWAEVDWTRLLASDRVEMLP
jgi:hypothetical protein